MIEVRYLNTVDGALCVVDGDLCAIVRFVLRDPGRPLREHTYQSLRDLSTRLRLAPDPADPTTWFDARTALPRR